MSRVDEIKEVRDRLNKVGKGFCAMKWLHETLYLHTGDNAVTFQHMELSRNKSRSERIAQYSMEETTA